MVTINLTTESVKNGKKDTSSSDTAKHADLFTQLLSNAIQQQKKPAVLDPKQAMQKAQTPKDGKHGKDFELLAQKVLKDIANKDTKQESAHAQKDANISKTHADSTSQADRENLSDMALEQEIKQEHKNKKRADKKQLASKPQEQSKTVSVEPQQRDTKAVHKHVERAKQSLAKADEELLSHVMRNVKEATKDSKRAKTATVDVKDTEIVLNNRANSKNKNDIKIDTIKIDKSVKEHDNKIMQGSTEQKLSSTKDVKTALLKPTSMSANVHSIHQSRTHVVDNDTLEDSVHKALLISHKILALIEKLYVQQQSGVSGTKPFQEKGPALLSQQEIAMLIEMSDELAQQGINLEDVLAKFEVRPRFMDAFSPQPKPKTQTVTIRLVERIEENLRNLLLDTIYKSQYEMPQSIMGLNKHRLSREDFMQDMQAIIVSLKNILHDTRDMSKAQKDIIAKEGMREKLIEHLLDDSAVMKTHVSQKELALLKIRSYVDNTHNQKPLSPKDEIIHKILSSTRTSLSFFKEIASSLKSYEQQVDLIQKFADFAQLNLKDFRYSVESPSMFSELGAKNPLLQILLKGKQPSNNILSIHRNSLVVSSQGMGIENNKVADANLHVNVKHPLTPKLAALSIKTADMLGVQPHFRPNDAGRITLEELLLQQKLAIQKAVQETKNHSLPDSHLVKTLQTIKEEVFRETINTKPKRSTEKEDSADLPKKTKASTRKTSNVTHTKDKEDAKATPDKYAYQSNSNSHNQPKQINSTHAPQTTEQSLEFERNEYEKKRNIHQEIQKINSQNSTVFNAQNKRHSIAGASSVLDVMSSKIKNEQTKPQNIQAVVVDSDIRSEIMYRSAAARETLRNFTGYLREGINNYKPPLSKLSIELSPENLGTVEVTIKQRGTQLLVQIHSNPQALQLFMANAQDFKQQLFGIGYENIEMSFQDSDGNFFGGGDGSSNHEHHGHGSQQQQQHDEEHSTLEELQSRQSQDIIVSSKTWNSFGLQAYKNSDSVMQQLHLLELTLTPQYA